MMSKNNVNQFLVILFGLMLIIGALGIGVFYFGGAIQESVEDSSTTIVEIEDVDDDEDGVTDTNEENDDPIDEPPDEPPEVDPSPPDPEPDPVIVPDPEPDEIDDSFKGEFTVKASLLDEAGNPLSIALDFTKDPTGLDPSFEIDKLRIRYEWDFVLGKDLDPRSFNINVKGIIKRIYWQDLSIDYHSGTIYGQKIWDATGFDPKGYDTQTFDIESNKLRFNDMDGQLTTKAIVYTSRDSFIVDWVAEVKTKDGITHKVTGKTGIALNFYYVRSGISSTYGDYDYQDPDVQDYFGFGYQDPYFQEPLMSIVVG